MWPGSFSTVVLFYRLEKRRHWTPPCWWSWAAWRQRTCRSWGPRQSWRSSPTWTCRTLSPGRPSQLAPSNEHLHQWSFFVNRDSLSVLSYSVTSYEARPFARNLIKNLLIVKSTIQDVGAENREIIYRTKGIARAEPLNLEGEIRLVGVPIIFSMSDIVLFVGRYSVNCHLVSVPSQLAVISSFKRLVISSFKEWILCSAWSSKSPKNRYLSPPQPWNLRLKKEFMARV